MESRSPKPVELPHTDDTSSPGRAHADAAHGRAIGGEFEQFSAVAITDSPRQVIRGENPPTEQIHSILPNPAAAFVDWLNFTFPIAGTTGEKIRWLDAEFRRGFGFGITENRWRKHLNYDESWVLGRDLGIFATGGSSVGRHIICKPVRCRVHLSRELVRGL